MSRIPVECYEELDSTNAEARRRAAAGERGPLWISARRQTAGRGRRGRSWQTGEGNLAASLLLTVEVEPARAAQLSFVAALAAADLADACLGSGAGRLKWPNDLMIAGRKAAGILLEAGTHPQGGQWVVVGIGVNLAWAPAGLEAPATAFADHMGTPPDPETALDLLAGAFEHWRALWAQQGFTPVASAWTSRAHGLGARCEARLPDRALAGRAEGLDEHGALTMRLDDGSVARITAGDVYFEGS